MKLLKKNPQELTVGESLIYVILWFTDCWCSVKDFFSNLFHR